MGIKRVVRTERTRSAIDVYVGPGHGTTYGIMSEPFLSQQSSCSISGGDRASRERGRLPNAADRSGCCMGVMRYVLPVSWGSMSC